MKFAACGWLWVKRLLWNLGHSFTSGRITLPLLQQLANFYRLTSLFWNVEHGSIRILSPSCHSHEWEFCLHFLLLFEPIGDFWLVCWRSSIKNSARYARSVSISIGTISPCGWVSSSFRPSVASFKGSRGRQFFVTSLFPWSPLNVPPSISCCWSASSSLGSPFWTGVIKTACPALPSGSVEFSRFFSRLCFGYCRSCSNRFSLTTGDSLCLLSRCFSDLSLSLWKNSFRRHSSIVAKTLLNKYLVKNGYLINMKWT